LSASSAIFLSKTVRLISLKTSCSSRLKLTPILKFPVTSGIPEKVPSLNFIPLGSA
jgi:hypothetical protein